MDGCNSLLCIVYVYCEWNRKVIEALYAFSFLLLFTCFFPFPYSVSIWRLCFLFLCPLVAYALQVFMLQLQFQTTWESKWVLQERESAWSSGDWPSLRQMRSLFLLSMVKEGKSSNTAMEVSTTVPLVYLLDIFYPSLKTQEVEISV